MKQTLALSGFFLAVFSTVVVPAFASSAPTEITLPGTRLFTESITSTKDGTLFVGSVGKGTVSRIAPGSADAVEFLSSKSNGSGSVYGVFADEKHRTLWVCTNKSDSGDGAVALKSFDLKSGAAKGSYPLPGSPAFCNDIAVAKDGTAYVADTRQATLFMLKPGAKDFEVAAKDALLDGVDGVAFGEKSVLYVNSVSKGKLVRVTLGKDGKSTSLVDLHLSQPLTRPDGMRTIGKNRFLLAENSGNMDIVTVQGENAEIRTIKSGLEATPAVTATKGMAWIAEGKLNYRSDQTKDPGSFKLYAVPLR